MKIERSLVKEGRLQNGGVQRLHRAYYLGTSMLPGGFIEVNNPQPRSGCTVIEAPPSDVR